MAKDTFGKLLWVAAQPLCGLSSSLIVGLKAIVLAC